MASSGSSSSEGSGQSESGNVNSSSGTVSAAVESSRQVDSRQAPAARLHEAGTSYQARTASGEEDVEVVILDDEEAGKGAESSPGNVGSSYHLGRSQVTESALDSYVVEGLLSSAARDACRAPGREETPRPEPYEAVIFKDFLTAGLRFPCECFVCEVLERFDLQIHQLTPNAFARLGVFTVALKMMGSELDVNTFTEYYEAQLYEKMVSGNSGAPSQRLEFGSYNFVPQKSRGTMSIVPAFRNKWPGWQDHWFYVQVCTDGEVVHAIENNLAKASILVSKMTPMKGIRLAESFDSGTVGALASEAFIQTSRRQISCDLVEDWIAADQWPLEQGSGFLEFMTKSGYKGPRLQLARPAGYECDFDYVRYVEEQADAVLGPYNSKEHKAKNRGLPGVRRLNRIFDSMRVFYGDRLDPAPSTAGETAVQPTRGRGRGRSRSRGQKRPTSVLESAKQKAARADEPANVRIGWEIALPLGRRSWKVVRGQTRR